MTHHPNRTFRGELILTPISPVHIGSGRELEDIDYTIRDNQYAVKDIDRYFQDQADSIEAAMDAVRHGLHLGPDYDLYTLPFHGDKMRGGDARQAGGGGGAPRQHQDTPKEAFNNPFAAALGQGETQATGKPAPKQAKQPHQPTPPPKQDGFTVGTVRGFMKDAFGRPFLPGTSIKGVVRTAIAYHLARECGIDPAGIALRNRKPPKFAFRPVNDQILGASVLSDPLKALAISDSRPLPWTPGFACTRVRIMNTRQQGFSEKTGTPIHTESLMPGAEPVRIPIAIDRIRLEQDTALGRAARGKAVALLGNTDAFTAALKAFSTALVDYEAAFYQDRQQPQQAQWLRRHHHGGAILLPIGYGTGWHAKTLGMLMDLKGLEQAREQWRLGRRGVSLFPKSRKWADSPKGGRLPMGWCLCEVRWE